MVVLSSLFINSQNKEKGKDEVEAVMIKMPRKAGTYFTEIVSEVDDQEVSQIKRLHVKYPKTVLNYDKEEGIDAHDILVLTDTFKTKNTEDILKLGGVHAWSMDDGYPLESINVDVKDAIKYTGTVNQVIYSTDNKTSVEVNVFEQDEINVMLDELYMNQYSLFQNHIRTLSIIVLVLFILPGLVFLILFYILKRSAESLEDVLSD